MQPLFKRDPRLRVFARYTSNGDLISGTLLVRRKQPVGKGWYELVPNICCPITTTTTTTTTTSSTTTTTTTI